MVQAVADRVCADPGFASISLSIGLIPPKNFEYKIPENLAPILHPGCWVLVPFGRQKIWGVVDELAHTPVFNGRHQEIIRAHPLPRTLRDNAFRLARSLARHYGASLAQTMKTTFPLSAWGRFSSAVEGNPLEPSLEQPSAEMIRPISLSVGQFKALEKMEGHRGEGQTALYLQGPTGSGKTYVLLEFIRRRLAEGGSAIYLVPEISLTTQFADTIRRVFPNSGSFAVWSSGISAASKRRLWAEILDGKIRLILGTRSAVFLPLVRLGAIILDEEQDSSFKQESPPPCYHAREAAIWRSQLEGVTAVMSSATPSLECYHLIKEGKIAPAVLDERYGPARPPEIRIKQLWKGSEVIDRDLGEAIKKTISAGCHVVIFHNRRGYERGLTCSACGVAILCRQCDLPMILHKQVASSEKPAALGSQLATRNSQLALKCHHCGVTRKPPEACPSCKASGESLKARGFGTQRIAEDLDKRFNVRALRLDRDTSRRSGAIAEEFRSGASPVLIGTKLVTKGWHFPMVTLAVVLDADSELLLPDFRACERTYQTLAQVAGRSGRESLPGLVWIRTRHPGHYIYESLAQNDPEIFYERELSVRRQMNLPPFSRLFMVEISGKKRDNVQRVADEISQSWPSVHQADRSQAHHMGTAPCYFQRVRGKWRFQVVLRCPDPDAPVPMDALAGTLSRLKRLGTTVRLKPDPHNLL